MNEIDFTSIRLTIKSQFMINFDLNRVVDEELDGIDIKDAPDFCDAYIKNALYKVAEGTFRELSEEELDWVNEQREFVYNCVVKFLH